MTIADMSVIQAELEVDETDIVDVRLGQSVKVAIDALPDEEFEGTVTKIGSSALQQVASAQQATNFEVEVTLADEIPGARPGFSCTADITTATRAHVTAVPIQALTVREIARDENGQIVREKRETKRRRLKRDDSSGNSSDQEKEEEEGVFVVRDNEAVFTPIEIGIAGEKYFEVLSGLEEGDQVITGPFASVRDLQDGDAVKVEEEKGNGK
jgi:HlyD family secretion protein